MKMDLHITDYCGALEHRPSKNTYAIRISAPRFPACDPLIASDFYKCISSYSFNDTLPGRVMPGEILFSEDLALRMLRAFDYDRMVCESLLVHCSQGQNRSPAVAMALNDLFSLGHDTGKLMEQYPEYNTHVYNILKKVGERQFGHAKLV